MGAQNALQHIDAFGFNSEWQCFFSSDNLCAYLISPSHLSSLLVTLSSCKSVKYSSMCWPHYPPLLSFPSSHVVPFPSLLFNFLLPVTFILSPSSNFISSHLISSICSFSFSSSPLPGYNSMGLKLNKPYLRAAMEADCQKIMRGEVQRNDVVMACLNEMKARFLQAVSQASKLDDAVSKVTFFCFFLYSSFLFI
jgi:hypothetical protein